MKVFVAFVRGMMGLGIVLLLLGLVAWTAGSAPQTVALAPHQTPAVIVHIFLPFAGHTAPILKWQPDLGDAPDASNSYGASMTAYPIFGPPGVVARFPTVYKAGSPPYGPWHRQSTARYWLGPQVSVEAEADVGFDADPTHNLIPKQDRPNLDTGDDGINPNPVLPDCQLTKLQFTVTVPAGAPGSDAFINLWFDWDRSGDWGQKLQCPGMVTSEWAVQNQVISLPGPGVYSFNTLGFYPRNPQPVTCLWWRITLSNQPASSADGSGPAGGYLYGETEDYFSCPEPVAQQTDLGDAPDSTNSYGLPMTAYPAGGPLGVQARFPTVFLNGSPPYGPRHLNFKTSYRLGQMITAELEADIGPDADPANNIRPPFDVPDADLGDDGIAPQVATAFCTPAQLTYTVAVPAGAPTGNAFVNLWFDWNRNGSWGQSTLCPDGVGVVNEWAVQNQVVNLPVPGLYTFTTPLFLAGDGSQEACLWWRITLSDVPATAPDGSGPANGYSYGETEDYYACPTDKTPTPTPRPTFTPTPTPRPTATPTPKASPTATPTATLIIPPATHTPTPTRTPTRTPTLTTTPSPTTTPTTTPTATATPQIPVLTGISSTFTNDGSVPGGVIITIHVLDPALDGVIYDIDFLWNMQVPPWPGAEPYAAPQGWIFEPIPGGLRFVTSTNPLRTCQPVTFSIALPPDFPLGDFIIILLTDQNHQVIGQIASQRVGEAISGVGAEQPAIPANTRVCPP